jgi:hypothetical protein
MSETTEGAVCVLLRANGMPVNLYDAQAAEWWRVSLDKSNPADAPHSVLALYSAAALTAAEARGAQPTRQELEMADGCLAMIREDLESFGIDMSKTPPMMYNDAVRRSWQMAEARGAQRERARIVQWLRDDSKSGNRTLPEAVAMRDCADALAVQP